MPPRHVTAPPQPAVGGLGAGPGVNSRPGHTWSCDTGLLSDLLIRCGRGDASALAVLFDLLSPVVGRTVVAAAGPDRFEECVRDVFVEVWRTSPTYRPLVANPVSWVLDIAAAATSRSAARGVSGML